MCIEQEAYPVHHCLIWQRGGASRGGAYQIFHLNPFAQKQKQRLKGRRGKGRRGKKREGEEKGGMFEQKMTD